MMVAHCGSRESVEKGIDGAARAIGEVLAAFPISVLLENAAGQGGAIGKSITELSPYIARAGYEKVGFCLDTAHLFEAGYDVRRKTVWDRIIEEMEAAADRAASGSSTLTTRRPPLAAGRTGTGT